MSQPPDFRPGAPGPYGGYGPPGFPGYSPPGYGPGFGGPGWPPPKKSTTPAIAIAIGAAVFLAFMMLAIWQFLDPSAPSANQDAKRTVVVADDKGSQIEVPASWSPHPELNKTGRAVIRLADTASGEYLVVITEAKEDYVAGFTAEGYADTCLKWMKDEGALKNIIVSEPVKLEVGGRPAIQYDVSASSDVTNITFLLTFVEGAKAFHEIMSWTAKSKFTATKPEFVKVASTFRED